MRTQSAASAAAAVRPGVAFLSSFPIGHIVVVVAAAVAASSCVPPRVVAGADPADPAARVAPVHAPPVIDRYAPLRPQAPAAWPAQNRRVAPGSGEVQ